MRYKDLLEGGDVCGDIVKLLLPEPPCCIVYCHSRESTEEVSRALQRAGVAASAYHAGLPIAQRTQILADWSQGRSQVVVATVAFGMGIDRADVRLVIHYQMPKTLEGFYQVGGAFDPAAAALTSLRNA